MLLLLGCQTVDVVDDLVLVYLAYVYAVYYIWVTSSQTVVIVVVIITAVTAIVFVVIYIVVIGLLLLLVISSTVTGIWILVFLLQAQHSICTWHIAVLSIEEEAK